MRSGWIICSVGTLEGGRQITTVHLPGDLVGMPSLSCHSAVETIQAVTDVEVEVIPLDTFAAVFRDHPRLAALLYLWALEERQRMMNQMTMIGRMKGPQRIAAWLYMLYRRVMLTQPAPTLSFAMPLTQLDLADATGMTLVHANRNLKELRNQGIATWQNGTVTIHNIEDIVSFANIPSEQKRSTRWMSAIAKVS